MVPVQPRRGDRGSCVRALFPSWLTATRFPRAERTPVRAPPHNALQNQCRVSAEPMPLNINALRELTSLSHPQPSTPLRSPISRRSPVEGPAASPGHQRASYHPRPPRCGHGGSPWTSLPLGPHGLQGEPGALRLLRVFRTFGFLLLKRKTRKKCRWKEGWGRGGDHCATRWRASAGCSVQVREVGVGCPVERRPYVLDPGWTMCPLLLVSVSAGGTDVPRP